VYEVIIADAIVPRWLESEPGRAPQSGPSNEALKLSLRFAPRSLTPVR
jgi:hypothetical protein